MSDVPEPLRIGGPAVPGAERVLTESALATVVDVVRLFRPRIQDLLAARRERLLRLDQGEPLDFLAETKGVRESDWRVAPAPAEVLDRRVEITGPTDRKMVINALNSGANVFMADLEDSTSPTWTNVVQGQVNLLDAAERTITFTSPDGREYHLAERTAVLMFRPRGLHLTERHVLVDGQVAPAALVDAALFVHGCSRPLLDRGSAPYLYLPKLESYREAALWDEVLSRLEERQKLPRGTVRVTVLIETLPAAFQMDEILYALRDRILGLNCGRWDYIFSFVKQRRADPSAVLPDRGQVTMSQPFLAAYAQLCVETCHRRGAHAMGGMAAQIPIKGDPEANERALAAVRADKEREVALGHDGTWVAHPGLVALAKEVFDAGMPEPNQLGRRYDLQITADQLLQVPEGTRTEAGLRTNLRVAVQYLAAWLGGLGCVPIDHRMEDAATAEISRAQVWQWVRHGAALEDGRVITAALVRDLLDEEVQRLGGAHVAQARAIVEQLCLSAHFEEFLTLPAYAALTEE